MRLNKYIASTTSLSRRAADEVIKNDRVRVNGAMPTPGYDTKEDDEITLDGKVLAPPTEKTIVLALNKPLGYVCSRRGQGSKTVYELVPKEYSALNLIGRLDKDSSGLILFTNDGSLIQEFSHPSKNTQKVYEVVLNKPFSDREIKLLKEGIVVRDYVSKLDVKPLPEKMSYKVTMQTGKNRQIRKTFIELGIDVVSLKRIQMGPYTLGDIEVGNFNLL